MIDAVIVLDQINCYKYMINYSFKLLSKNTNDADMRAIRYQLLNSPVISSTIKSTIHIGSNIINNGLDLSGKNVYKSDFASDEFKEMCRNENPDIDDVYFAEYRYLLWKD